MKNGSQKYIWLAGLLLLLVLAGSSGPSGVLAAEVPDSSWQVQVLEVRGAVGSSADIALDAAGHPHVAYSYDGAAKSELKYAYFDGFRWHSEVVDEAVSTGEYVSIGLTADGQPRISYFHRAQTALKYATRTANGWQTEVVDGNLDRGRFSSLVLDPISGIPNIIYYEAQGERLLHVQRSGNQWVYKIVDESASVGEDAALAWGTGGILGASYYDRTNGNLKYAQWDPSNRTWAAQTVDSEGDVGHTTSIVFDSEGAAHISYYGTIGADNVLRHAQGSGTTWTTRTVDSGIQMGTSIAIGRQGLPVIAYRRNGIRLARLVDGNWNLELVDGETRLGRTISLAWDASSEREHLVYAEEGFRDLVYATWGPTWQERVLGEGDRASLVVRNGQPKIAWRKSDGPSSLVLSTASSGSAWSEGFIRAAPGDSENGFVVDENGGHHIAFYQSTTRRLFYATQVNGLWEFDEVATLPEGTLFQPNLRLVFTQGDPAIVYTAYDGSVSMRLVRRVNGVWQTNVHSSAAPLGTEPTFDALVLGNGTVVISYFDAENGDLRLASWNGSGWFDSLVDPGENGEVVGEFNALAQGLDATGEPVTSQVLAIAYYDRTNQAIRYSHNANGQWVTTTLVPDAGVLNSLDLAVAGETHSLPYVAYGAQDGSVRLAYSDDDLQTISKEVVAQESGTTPSQVKLAYDNQPRLVYRNGAGAIVYAFPTARTAVPAAIHNDSGLAVGQLAGAGLDLPVCLYFFVQPKSSKFAPDSTLSRIAQFTLAAPLTDGAVMQEMTRRFQQSAEGQRYIDLFTRYAQEMATIARKDPGLVWDGYRTLHNFMPGLEAWAAGRGDEIPVTQEMVDQALALWQRIASASSPALATVINAELAETHQLQDFVDRSFEDWATDIGVISAANQLYLPVVHK